MKFIYAVQWGDEDYTHRVAYCTSLWQAKRMARQAVEDNEWFQDLSWEEVTGLEIVRIRVNSCINGMEPTTVSRAEIDTTDYEDLDERNLTLQCLPETKVTITWTDVEAE